MERLFRTHREAEARRDYDAIMDTFTPECYLETIALGSRSEGREAARAAYVGYFTAFPDLTPNHGRDHHCRRCRHRLATAISENLSLRSCDGSAEHPSDLLLDQPVARRDAHRMTPPGRSIARP
jgi:hypothetical protein